MFDDDSIGGLLGSDEGEDCKGKPSGDPEKQIVRRNESEGVSQAMLLDALKQLDEAALNRIGLSKRAEPEVIGSLLDDPNRIEMRSTMHSIKFDVAKGMLKDFKYQDLDEYSAAFLSDVFNSCQDREMLKYYIIARLPEKYKKELIVVDHDLEKFLSTFTIVTGANDYRSIEEIIYSFKLRITNEKVFKASLKALVKKCILAEYSLSNVKNVILGKVDNKLLRNALRGNLKNVRNTEELCFACESTFSFWFASNPNRHSGGNNSNSNSGSRNGSNNSNTHSGGNSNSNKRNKVCFICKSDKHRWFKCPDVKCRKCKEKGHTSRDCTGNKSNSNSESPKVLNIAKTEVSNPDVLDKDMEERQKVFYALEKTPKNGSYLRCSIYKDSCEVFANLDLGANVSCVRYNVLKKIFNRKTLRKKLVKKRLEVTGVGGKSRADFKISLPIKFKKGRYNWTFYVFRKNKDLPEDLIIGNDFVRYYKPDILDGNTKFIINNETVKVLDSIEENLTISEDTVIKARTESVVHINNIKCLALTNKKSLISNNVRIAHGILHPGVNKVLVANLGRNDIKLQKNQKLGSATILDEIESRYEPITDDEMDRIEDAINPALSKSQREQFRELLKRYWKSLSNTKIQFENVPDYFSHKINTSTEDPVVGPQYRVPIHYKEEVEKQINELLENGLIEKSNSPYRAPIVIVKKKDSSLRLCVDFKKLNAQTVKDEYPIPDINESLAMLGKGKYFTSLDLLSGYHQLRMHEDDAHKTAFVVNNELYHWKVMPFGLKNAPSTFQRMMNEILMDYKFKFVLVYLDDILVVSDSFDSHVEHVKAVLDKLSQYKLKIKLSKCKFAMQKLSFLGHKVSAEGIEPDDDKIKAIKRLRPPKDVKSLQRQLGLLNYYRKFIAKFADIAAPLYKLLKKGTDWIWKNEHQNAWVKLIKALCDEVMLAHPDFTKKFILETDASKFAVGVSLMQENEEGFKQPIYFASKKLSPAEQNYSASERECLAIIFALNYFRHFLLGSDTIVFTDHKPLTWLFNNDKTSTNQRLARWLTTVREFNIDAKYLEGPLNVVADSLSRDAIHPVEENLINSGNNTNVNEHGDEITYEMNNDELDEAVIHTINAFIDNEISIEEVKKQQLDDDELGTIYKYLHGKEVSEDLLKKYVPEDNTFMLGENDLVYKAIVVNRREAIQVICIPPTLTYKIVRLMHEGALTGAHFSANKCYTKLVTRFYWKNMYSDVEKCIKKCKLCQHRNNPRSKTLTTLDNIVAERPWQIVGVDVTGPFQTSDRGNTEILVFIDHFTKYAELVPVKQHTANICAKKLINKIILRHGVPERLLSDRGRNFIDNVSTLVYKILGIKKITTTAYHPQGNGITERINRTIKNSLAKYVYKHQKDWDVYLRYINFAYNTTQHSATKETPFFLMHGRRETVPIDIVFANDKKIKDSGLTSTKKIKAYKDTLITNLKEGIDRAKYFIERNKQSNNRRIAEKYANVDANDDDQNFNVGDLVWLYDERGIEKVKRVKQGSKKDKESRKLKLHWTGPFEVSAKPSKVTYKLKKAFVPNARSMTVPVHRNRLKKVVADKVPKEKSIPKNLKEHSSITDQFIVLEAYIVENLLFRKIAGFRLNTRYEGKINNYDLSTGLFEVDMETAVVRRKNTYKPVTKKMYFDIFNVAIATPDALVLNSTKWFILDDTAKDEHYLNWFALVPPADLRTRLVHLMALLERLKEQKSQRRREANNVNLVNDILDDSDSEDELLEDSSDEDSIIEDLYDEEMTLFDMSDTEIEQLFDDTSFEGGEM